MNKFKYKYLDQEGSLLCEEWVQDDMSYKFSLELEKHFYFLSDGTVETKWNHGATRNIHVKMKFVKILDGDYYYKISDIVSDSDMEWEEW